VEIPVGKNTFALVDDADWDLYFCKWSTNRPQGAGFYAIRTFSCNGKRSRYPMHRVVLERKINRKLETSEIADHINGNTLDNRRSNLRVATTAQSVYNRSMSRRKPGGSKYRGINFEDGKWVARVFFKRKSIYLGRFDNEIDAALAHDAKALELFGEFHRPNFPK